MSREPSAAVDRTGCPKRPLWGVLVTFTQLTEWRGWVGVVG